MVSLEKRRRGGISSLALLLLSLALICYFGIHAVRGDRGLEARVFLQKQIVNLEDRLGLLREERAKLERDIALLQPEQIDPDMLDEQARRILNYSRPGDIILLKPKTR